MNDDNKFFTEDLKKLLDYYDTHIRGYMNNSSYFDYETEDVDSNDWRRIFRESKDQLFNTVNFSDWNLSTSSIPGYKKLSNLFTKDNLLSHSSSFDNLETFIEYGALIIVNTKRRIGIRDVRFNSWLLVSFEYLQGCNTIILEYFFDGVEEKVSCKNIEEVYRLILSDELLIRYLDSINNKLYMLAYVAKIKCKSFLEELGRVSSSVYSKDSPKCGFVLKTNKKINNYFELDKRCKDFIKINIPCDVKFIRNYDIDSLYAIYSLQDLELAMYTELTDLLSHEIDKMDLE